MNVFTKSIKLVVIIGALASLFSSCQTMKNIKRNKTLADIEKQENDYSDIPWNSPSSWEGKGRFGDALPTSR